MRITPQTRIAELKNEYGQFTSEIAELKNSNDRVLP